MLTYKDILYATTKILSNNFECDVIVDNAEGTFDKECFYVTLVPINITANTKNTDKRSLVISIKYFNNSKMKNYEVANSLENLFNRKLQVNDRFLNVSNVEPNFLKDEVGNMLDFLISINYCDDIKQVVEEIGFASSLTMNNEIK